MCGLRNKTSCTFSAATWSERFFALAIVRIGRHTNSAIKRVAVLEYIRLLETGVRNFEYCRVGRSDIYRKLLNCSGIPGGLARKWEMISWGTSFFALVTRSESPWMLALAFSFNSLMEDWIVLAVSLSMPLFNLTSWRTVL